MVSEESLITVRIMFQIPKTNDDQCLVNDSRCQRMVTQLVIVGQYQYREERNMEDNIVVFVGYQRFKCIGSKNIVTEDHQKIRLLIMQSYCPDCGKKFETTTTKRALRDNRPLCRRCDNCIQQRVCVSATRIKIFGI
jgi:hypothetical protein